MGLGSQVKAHNERRFSDPLDRAGRAAGRVCAKSLRAIFRCWEYGEKLNYQGKYYNFSLMTPEFSPRPSKLPLPPIAMAAVGPLMLKTAARDRRQRPAAQLRNAGISGAGGRARCWPRNWPPSGKSFEHFEITGGGFIATGPDAAAVKAAAEKVRYRVAFYGSTPAYRGVFDLHGVTDLGREADRDVEAGQMVGDGGTGPGRRARPVRCARHL